MVQHSGYVSAWKRTATSRYAQRLPGGKDKLMKQLKANAGCQQAAIPLPGGKFRDIQVVFSDAVERDEEEETDLK